jgi:hypothetical protein
MTKRENEFSREMDRKFNALWEQCIQWKKETIQSYLKENNQEMVEFNQRTLEAMEKRYAQVKIKT